MFDQIINKKGEKLYILTTVFTNEIKPFIVVDTWAKCKERLEGMTKEKDNPAFFIQLIHKNINEEKYLADASVRCTRKGLGNDFFKYITIEPLYTQAWE